MKYLLPLIFITDTFAAGSGHITDLIYPAINATIFFGGFLYLAVKKLPGFFASNAKEIEDIFNKAAEKAKEADLKLETFKSKIENVESDMQKVINDAEIDGNKFEEKFQTETLDSLERYKRDMNRKLESEKTEALQALNAELLNSVIQEAKKSIQSDTGLQTKAADKLLKNL